MATVGYGDFSFAMASAGLKIYAILLMIVGAGSLTVLFACVTNLLLTRRLAELSSQLVSSNLREHVIIAGFGSIGLAIAQSIIDIGHQVVVIENDASNRYLPEARAMKATVIIGDSTSAEVLRRAGVLHSHSLAAVTSDDAANLETALIARGLNGKIKLAVRVYDQNVAHRMAAAFSLKGVLSVSALVAPFIIQKLDAATK